VEQAQEASLVKDDAGLLAGNFRSRNTTCMLESVHATSAGLLKTKNVTVLDI
jgi:hypothetical protein